jgi:hypothetical protein
MSATTLLPPRAAQMARTTAVVLLFLDAILVAVGVLEVIPALVAAGVFIAIAVVLTIDINSIEEVSATTEGFSFKRKVAEAQAAAADAPEEEADEQVPRAADDEGKLTDLRLRLEAKLSYITGHMNLDSGAVLIGSLRYDGYLSDDEAATADRILRMTEEELARASQEDREAFLRAAEDLVASIRAIVLAGAVRKALTERGWKVERIPDSKRDLLATNGRTLRLVPLFATAEDSRLPRAAARRLGKLGGLDRRIVVLPDNSRYPTSASDDPATVKLSELDTALAE